MADIDGCVMVPVIPWPRTSYMIYRWQCGRVANSSYARLSCPCERCRPGAAVGFEATVSDVKAAGRTELHPNPLIGL